MCPLARMPFLGFRDTQGSTLAMCPLARMPFLGFRATTVHFLLARGASDFHFGGKHVHYFFPLIYPV